MGCAQVGKGHKRNPNLIIKRRIFRPNSRRSSGTTSGVGEKGDVKPTKDVLMNNEDISAPKGERDTN